MVTVTLTKTEQAGNTYTLTFNNLRAWGGNANFPVIANPLPQEDADRQILLKIMGNSVDTKYSWVMKDESSTVFTGTGNPDIKLVEEQIAYWLSTFRPQYIDDKYTLTFNFTQPITLEGVISNFQWNMSGDAPVSAECSFQFLQGDVIASGTYEVDTPSVPLNVVASSPASGQLKQDWVEPENVGSSAITSYMFQYRLKGTQTWNQVQQSSATFTYTKTGLASGTYECNILPENAQGFGQPSVPKDVVVA